METILNNGFFWGFILIAFAAIVGYFANWYVEHRLKTDKD
jgi:hypothetical protein